MISATIATCHAAPATAGPRSRAAARANPSGARRLPAPTRFSGSRVATRRSAPAFAIESRRVRGATLRARASKGDRVSIGDMKQALVAAGVDTSSCFERSDLEGKYALLTDDQKAMKEDASAASKSGDTFIKASAI